MLYDLKNGNSINLHDQALALRGALKNLTTARQALHSANENDRSYQSIERRFNEALQSFRLTRAIFLNNLRQANALQHAALQDDEVFQACIELNDFEQLDSPLIPKDLKGTKS